MKGGQSCRSSSSLTGTEVRDGLFRRGLGRQEPSPCHLVELSHSAKHHLSPDLGRETTRGRGNLMEEKVHVRWRGSRRRPHRAPVIQPPVQHFSSSTRVPRESSAGVGQPDPLPSRPCQRRPNPLSRHHEFFSKWYSDSVGGIRRCQRIST